MNQQDDTQMNDEGDMEPPPQIQPDVGYAPQIETGGEHMPPVDSPPPEIPAIFRDVGRDNFGDAWARAEEGAAEQDLTTLPDANNTTTETVPPVLIEEKAILLPIYIYTAIFGAIFLLGPLFVRRGPNMGITRCCIMLSAFCCWIFWTTTYIVQLNPLLGPRLGNETLAWIGHKWGKNPIDVPDDDSKLNKTANVTVLLRRSFYDANLSNDAVENE